MHEAGDFFQSLADPRSGPENLVGRIRIDAPLFHSGNRLQISPIFERRSALRSHAGLDDDLRCFGHHVLVREVEPGLSCIAGNIVTARQGNELVDEILAADRDQRPKPHRKSVERRGAGATRSCHLIQLAGYFLREFSPCFRDVPT